MDMTAALTPKTRIGTLVKKSLIASSPAFLASTGIKGTDGNIHAIEVRILPQPTPDGGRQLPWDLKPNAVTTNPTVGTVTKNPEGEVVHVKFNGGNRHQHRPRRSGPGFRSRQQTYAETGRGSLRCRLNGAGRRPESDLHACRDGRHKAVAVSG
jgi:hypothetical protein